MKIDCLFAYLIGSIRHWRTNFQYRFLNDGFRKDISLFNGDNHLISERKIKNQNPYFGICLLWFALKGVNHIVPEANAQAITKEEFKDSLSRVSYFSIHKDNYFITGIPTNTIVNSSTSNAKYQIIFKQMITRAALPWETHLFLTYSQKAFWNLYKESFPFREINFNPAVVLGKAIFGKDDRLNGIASLSYEHEANGRDLISSRSWNNISLEYAAIISSKITTRVKAWVLFAYQCGNPDILNYVGLGQIDLSYEIKSNQFYFELMLRKGLQWNFNGVFRQRIYYNPFGYVIKSNERNFLNGHHVP